MGRRPCLAWPGECPLDRASAGTDNRLAGPSGAGSLAPEGLCAPRSDSSHRRLGRLTGPRASRARPHAACPSPLLPRSIRVVPKPARVAAVHRGGLELVTDAGPCAGFLTGRLRHAASSPLDLPAVGDWVALRPGVGRRPCRAGRAAARSSARRDGGREPQVLAANVDLVVVVASMTRELDVGRIQRMLTLAADAPADALVVLSKADLDPDPAARVAEVRAAIGGAAPVLPSRPSTAAASTPSPRCSAPASPASCSAPPASARPRCSTASRAVSSATGPVRDGRRPRAPHHDAGASSSPLASGGVVIDTPGLKLPRIWEQASGLAACSPTSRSSRGLPLPRLPARRRARLRGRGGARGRPPRAERLAARTQLGREEAWAESRRDDRARRERKDAHPPHPPRTQAAASERGEPPGGERLRQGRPRGG